MSRYNAWQSQSHYGILIIGIRRRLAGSPFEIPGNNMGVPRGAPAALNERGHRVRGEGARLGFQTKPSRVHDVVGVDGFFEVPENGVAYSHLP